MAEATLTQKLLPFKPHPHMDSPERSGMLTPPLHSLAAVPFQWEEEPGKPRECTILSKPINKCLELPPRLLFDTNNKKRLPSPTTVLDGPYTTKSFSKFRSSSFRMVRRRDLHSPEKKERSFWSWRKKKTFNSKEDVDNEDSNSKQVKLTRIKRAGSFSIPSHVAKPHFWATVYDRLKHVVTWKRKKLNRGGL